jgi:hypothetical protein
VCGWCIDRKRRVCGAILKTLLLVDVTTHSLLLLIIILLKRTLMDEGTMAKSNKTSILSHTINEKNETVEAPRNIPPRAQNKSYGSL